MNAPNTADEFVATVTYSIAAALYSPDGKAIGRLERPWAGPESVGEMTAFLLANSKARADLDKCHIEIRWWKDEVIGESGKVPERDADDHEERGTADAPREARQEGLVEGAGQAEG